MERHHPDSIGEQIRRLNQRVTAEAGNSLIDAHVNSAFMAATGSQKEFIIRHQDELDELFGLGSKSIAAGLISASEGSIDMLAADVGEVKEHVRGLSDGYSPISEKDDCIDRLHFRKFGTVPRSRIDQIRRHTLLGNELSFIAREQDAFGYALAYMHPQQVLREEGDPEMLRSVWVETVASEGGMGARVMVELMQRSQLVDADMIHLEAEEGMADFLGSERIQKYIESQFQYEINVMDKRASHSVLKKHIAPHIVLRKMQAD